MDKPDGLPRDVVEAIRSNQKILAIKRLRQHRGAGLKEAKRAVEAYMTRHPPPKATRKSEGVSVRLLAWLAVILIGGVLLFRRLG